jgi:stearoyl-CoA desaturase (delta-9 desaturase)
MLEEASGSASEAMPPSSSPEIAPKPHVSEQRRVRVARSVQIFNLLAVILPFLGLFAAGLLLWGGGFSWVELVLLLVMYLITGLGITVGYHRLFTHRSFETSRVMQFIIAVSGSMAVQGPLLRWVAVHRRHHQFSDRPDDPHSPHHQGQGFLGMIKGLWHSHLGWLFRPDPPQLARYVTDLRQSKALRVASNLFPVWVLAGLLIPAVLGGLLTWTWMGVLSGLVWGGLVRIFAVHHVTWSINSVCHIWGRQPYRCQDESRDNFIFGVLGLGEGWHHSHHTFPTSARHGLRWWQFDASYYCIKVLSFLGLAWNVKVPTRQAQRALRS